MPDKKRVVKKRQRTSRKPSGEFNFSREMIPVLSNEMPEAEFLTQYRAKAWESFERNKLPTTNEEAWRRTDLRRLESEKFEITEFEGGSEIPFELVRPISENDLGGQITMTQQDSEIYLNPDLHELGVIFTDMKTAAIDHPEILEKILGQLVKPDGDKFSAMAAAFSKDGVLLYVPKGIQIKQPFQSLFWGSEKRIPHFSHVLVFLEDQASAIFIHESSSESKNGQQLHSGIVELFVGREARLKFIEIQSWSDHVWNFTHERARVERDGHLDWIYGAIGSHLTKNFSEIELVGQGATGNMAGFYFTNGDQHLDHDTQQNHLAPNTTSDLLFKGALNANSRSVWQGMIYVAPDAQKTDGYQSNPNLLLDKNARADSIPGLEILADDVRCTHGATISKVNPGEVFYLNSRGISIGEAERLIVEGFFEPILKQIPYDNLRKRLQQAIVDKLS
jgi:Fe-S cluster assembly protein SufD